MTTISNNNKRIVKNTLFLYFRMMLTMLVSLFTSRVILNTLGIVDYGLNNVIAGVITLFAFVNGALGAASSRFLTFELAGGNKERLKKIFSTSFNIHFCMGIIIVLFCETIGLWLVNNILNIPPERLFACNVIYQFVIISAFLTTTQVPLYAIVISYERMSVYAYLGISDAILKLCIAYFITISTFDKLITLGVLNLIVVIGVYIFIHIYCKHNFSEYTIAVSREKKLYKEMIGYSAWSLLGSSAGMLKNQGVNILMNIFFGPVVNAANAIAYQVNNALINFSNNFTTALNPQIIKSYANKDYDRMKRLVFRGGKFSFFLLMILSIPILLETKMILHLWLKSVPEYTVILTRLVVLLTLVESFTYTLGVVIQATGKIRNYQILVSGLILLNFPLSYLFYKLGGEPSSALITSITLSVIAVFIRIFIVKRIIKMTVKEYIKEVLFTSIITLITSILIPLVCHLKMHESIERLILILISSTISSLVFIYLLGMNKEERIYIISLIKKII